HHARLLDLVPPGKLGGLATAEGARGARVGVHAPPPRQVRPTASRVGRGVEADDRSADHGRHVHRPRVRTHQHGGAREQRQHLRQRVLSDLVDDAGAGGLRDARARAPLGLTSFGGDLRVLGLDPRSQRDALMRDVSFIADVAVLPRWLRVSQALDLVEHTHPRFDRSIAEGFLAKTDIKRTSRVGQLSKGMVTQLHLALILAIDARLLVLDEPTLGLDLLYRRQFYDTLLNDYFDKERTILITTHQVEEVEQLFTDVIFISRGHFTLNSPVEELGNRYQ